MCLPASAVRHAVPTVQLLKLLLQPFLAMLHKSECVKNRGQTHTVLHWSLPAGGEAVNAAGGPALLRPLVLIMHKGDAAGKAAAAGAAGHLCTSPDVAAMLATVSQ